MAIVKMNKFTLLTFESYKSNLLKELQKFGDVHFKNLQKDELAELKFLNKDLSPEKVSHYESELAKIKFTMSKTEPYITRPKGLKALTEPPRTMDFDEFDTYLNTYDYNKVYFAVKAEDEKINAAKAEITKLRAENDGLRTWLRLDIALAELERLKYVNYLIGTVSKVAAESFRLNVEESFPASYIEFLGNIKDDIAALIIVPSQDYDEAFTFLKTLGFSKLALNFKGIPAEVISSNNNEIENLQASQTGALDNIKELAAEYDKLEIACDYYETVLERERACQNFLKTQSVLMIEGWVPDEDSQAFRDIVANICGGDHYLEEEEVEKDSEDVPIKLKNNKLVSAFEDITAMFSMPKYNEIDPTPLLTPFYMLFFGLMLGDAGFGLILLVASTVALKFFTLKEGMRRFLKFFFYLSFTTILAGFIYGSFFGISFFTPILTEDGTYKAILDSQADVLTMMIASVAIGVVQVLVGIGIKGYMLIRDGRVLAAISDSLFWIIALLSGIGLLLGAAGVLQGGIFTISKWAFILSLVGLAATQGRESPSLGGKIASGLYAVYGISGYVGDLVSYTRIAALALSGAYIGFSFNLMVGLIPAGFAKIVFGSFVFVLGQALNLGLSALGAYVHTCRLQYVEFFGKFYEGGGVPFDAFKLKNKYVTIKK